MSKKIIYILAIVAIYVIIANWFSFHKHRKDISLDKFNNKRVQIIGEVISFQKNIRKNRIKFILKSQSIQKLNISRKIEVVIYHDSNISVLFGKKILLYSKVNKIKDYKEFTKKRNFYYIDDYSIGNYMVIQKGLLWRRVIVRIRKFIITRLIMIHKQESKKFVPALLFGKKDMLNKTDIELIRRAGIGHILAVSGTHVGLLMAFIMMLCFFRKNNFTYIIIIFMSWLYVFLVGFNPSCIRAAIMLNFFLFAKILKRDYDPFYSIAWAGIFMLLARPDLVYSIGFQFSFAAVLGIKYYYSILYRLMSGLPEFFRKSLSVSFSAQAALFPLTIIYFQKAATLSFINNIIIIPLAGVVMGIGFTAFLLSIVSIFLGRFTAYLNMFIIKLIILIMKLNFYMPFNYISINKISFITIIAYYFYFLTLPKLKSIISKKEYKLLYIILNAFFVCYFFCNI